MRKKEKNRLYALSEMAWSFQFSILSYRFAVEQIAEFKSC